MAGKRRNWQRAAAVVTLAFGALGASTAEALITYTGAGWTVGIGGTVNAFYVQGQEKNEFADGTESKRDDRASVQNGTLPGWINFEATTQQKGLDIKVHFGFAPGIGNNSENVGLPSGANTEIADAYSKIDSRNVYFQLGNGSIGTFKFGRDIGMFGTNPILNDMTLLGVGGTPRAAQPFNTSFGNAGHGYMYTGFQPQITYSTPNLGGFSASLGVFNPLQYDTTAGGLGDERKVPQVQASASFDWKGPVRGKVWTAGVYNKTSGDGGQEAVGIEGGGTVGVGPVDAVLNAFWAKGLGISTIGAQFLVIPDASGGRLESNGVFAQLTYKVIPDLKLGVNYGRNVDKDLTGEGDAVRQAFCFGAYYSLTPSITLVGEYINETGKNLLGAPVVEKQKAQSLSLGAIVFF